MIGLVLALVTLCWSLALSIVSATAMVRARRQALPARSAIRRVALLRPCAGDEPHLADTLASSGALRCSADLQIRLSVADEGDGARGPTQRAAKLLRDQGLDAHAVVVPTRGPNYKIGQLSAIDRELSNFDAVVVADSDVDLTGFDLDALVGALDDKTAATWSPPVESHATTWADRASAAILGGSLHSFTLLSGLDPGGLVGKTFAVRSDALASVGGFSSFARHLGEDMELARRLRGQGLTTHMVPMPVHSRASGRNLRAIVERYTRWLMVIRSQRTALLASYPLLFAATPIVAALSVTAVMLGSPLGLLALVLVAMNRWGVAVVAARRCGRPRSWGTSLLDALLADALLLVAFACALGPARVRWRDRTLTIGKHGLLVGS